MVRAIGNFFKGSGDDTQPAGTPLVSENGGADRTTTRAMHPDRPVNIDLLLLNFSMYSVGRLPDNFIDAAGTTYDIGTGLADASGNGKNDNSGGAGKINPASVNSKTPNLSVNPMFLKKGNVIYFRSLGSKLRVNCDGTQSVVPDSSYFRANDTFPYDIVPPDYIYPH